ncbi:MAG TPA: PEGA domain-containing protein [Methanolinea sp.]|nr:PEGA domain-containing protein [Methanolinea sp.]
MPGTITIGTPTVPTTEPTTVPTTEPTTVPTTEPTTVPTTVPTTAPAGYGTVFVNSYPTGATVLVDGVDKGRTNIIIPSVPAGVRTFTVMKEGYLTQTFPVTVPVGGIATPPRVTLVKGTSPTTTVTTVPTGTQATTATTTTTLTTSITTAATTTPMPGTTGSLFIMYCSPAGAEIFIDGEFAGYSSMFGSRISGISPGSHVLTISREGYVTDERTIAITAGKTTFIPVIYLRPRIIF